MSEPRPAPYPADTRAKGWRFELDYERIDQSDTWDIAAEIPMAQHALVFMWLTAWRQEPCGSLPNDEAVIRVKCRIPPPMWETFREVCMRGWTLADDGRLYHDTITVRVIEMLEYRRKEAERRSKNRAKPDGEPVASRGTKAGQPAETTASPDTGTGTGTKTEAVASVAAKSPRAAKKCPATFEPTDPQTWIDEHCPGLDWQRETDKFRDHTFATARTDWFGAWRNWMRKAAEGLTGKHGLTFRERDEQNARAKVAEMTGGLVSAKPPQRRFDLQLVEDQDGPARILG